jgi:hypothetical protein
VLYYAKVVFRGGHVPTIFHWYQGVAEQSATTHCRQVSTFLVGHVRESLACAELRVFQLRDLGGKANTIDSLGNGCASNRGNSRFAVTLHTCKTKIIKKNCENHISLRAYFFARTWKRTRLKLSSPFPSWDMQSI